MDDSPGFATLVCINVATYPIYLARTLIQLGYEPVVANQDGGLPNIFSYISIIRSQRGYSALYTGLKYYLPAYVLKETTYDLMASVTNHKKETTQGDASEIIAVCLRESALKIHSTIITYPLVTLCIGSISSAFFGTKETVEYTLESLYKGIVPKLIVEVTMVWVCVITRRLTAALIEDVLGQAIVSRVPPFIVQSLLHPLTVVSTVMADNGRSEKNPRFDQWQQCFRYLRENNQLKRGSSIFFRYSYEKSNSNNLRRRYF